jgi:cytochrome c-type biogenesis protein CcsB
MSNFFKILSFVCFLGTGFGSASQAIEAAPLPVPVHHSGWSFSTMGLIPVQSGGRIKPFDSFARELTLFETGSRSFDQWNSVDFLLSLITFPEYWETQKIIRITREDVKRQLGLDDQVSLYAPKELFKNTALAQYAEKMDKGSQGSEPPGAPKTSPREQELRAVLDRISVFHGLISGKGWLLLPKPAPAVWGDMTDIAPESEPIRTQFVNLLRAYQGNDEAQFGRVAELLKAAVEGEISGYEDTTKSKVQAESLYNRSRPFLIAWICYLVAGLLWTLCEFIPASKALNRVKNLALSVTVFAASSQIAGIALRSYVAERPPVTNMYESIIWVSLGVIGFGAIIYALHKQGVVLAVACMLATFGLIAGDSAPAILDPSIHPLVPVLRSNYWLTIHVLTITLGYAAFALSLGIANITLFQFLKKPKRASKPAIQGAPKAPTQVAIINNLNQLNYRAIQFGVVFIAAGTILGGIWADYSWGRFWGWDPKEVWALITLLCYLAILHGRYASWVGQFGFAVMSGVSFLSVVMAWYGVNFVLGVGLHSYGFSTGGTPWVLGFVGAQLLFILSVAVVNYFYRRSKIA